MHGRRRRLIRWGGILDSLDGQTLYELPRQIGALFDYPVVADVDNDASADLLLVTSGLRDFAVPALTVLHDRERRWQPARRIHNQDSYHVTNVNEDATIPQHEKPHWKLSNRFRAQLAFSSEPCRSEP